jgi:hypothetical protein
MNPYDYYPSEAELQAKKREYAAALVRDPWHRDIAARFVEQRETHISFILTNWQFDNDVNRYMREIHDAQKTEALIPTKEDFAASIWRDALMCNQRDMKLDYYKLFASVMGYVEKPGGNAAPTTNIAQQNVLIMPPSRDAESIVAALVEQQRKLINVK